MALIGLVEACSMMLSFDLNTACTVLYYCCKLVGRLGCQIEPGLDNMIVIYGTFIHRKAVKISNATNCFEFNWCLFQA